jgi:hypothetical protein
VVSVAQLGGEIEVSPLQPEQNYTVRILSFSLKVTWQRAEALSKIATHLVELG